MNSPKHVNVQRELHITGILVKVINTRRPAARVNVVYLRLRLATITDNQAYISANKLYPTKGYNSLIRRGCQESFRERQSALKVPTSREIEVTERGIDFVGWDMSVPLKLFLVLNKNRSLFPQKFA